MDVSQYLEIFLDETREHLQNLNTEILNLEQDPENEDTVNEIFRAAHSLKGMAGTMGYKRMQTLTHDMENVFSEVRNGTIKIKSHMIDILFQCLDALEEYTTNIQENSDEGTNDNEALIKLLNDCLKPDGAQEETPAPESTAGKPAAAASGGSKWSSIPLDEAQKLVLGEAVKQGKKVYGITVKVQESCILKAARAFLVFKAVEELGEILVSAPSAQDIEDEKFELDFSIIVITDSPLDRVLADIKSVSEIEEAEGAEMTDFGGTEEEAASPSSPAAEKAEKSKEKSVPAKTETAKASGAENAPAAKAGAAKQEKKSNAKAVGNRTVRVDIEKLDVLMNLVSELIIAKNSLVSATTTQEGRESNAAVDSQIEYLENVTTSLHESVMKVRMVPIESVVNKFPRMIRDLSKKLDKKMDLQMTGEETELDRTVVDEIGDPLMHLLRNSADHGLESAEVRAERGKPEVGSIFLNAYQDGNNVIIEVGDDGNGIDVENVKNKAIERGTVTPEQIETLGGEVEVKTQLGEGSTWIIRLPLTLAIIQALMVEVGGEKYAISLNSVTTLENIAPSDVKLVQSEEVIHLRGSVIPLIRLNEVLDIESTRKENENMIVAIVKKGDKLAGLVVDKLMGQQEIVIKSLGKFVDKTRIISGATILGDGEVALILDANVLI